MLKPNKHDWNDKATANEVLVTVLCEPNLQRSRREECWIKDGSDRKKINIDSLVRLSEHVAAQAWLKLDEIAREATATATKAMEAIPRYNADSLMLAAKENS